MTDQTSSLSIPPKWREKFLIKRIDEDSIEITLEQRDSILKALDAGARFIQIGKYTLMLNAIKSIDPKIEPNNIPPRPDDVIRKEVGLKDGVYQVEESPNPEVELWDKLYGEKDKTLIPKTASSQG